MKRWRAVAGATAIAGLAAALLAASPVGAQEEPTTSSSVPDTTSSSVPDSTTSSSVPDTTTSSSVPDEPAELPISVNPATVNPGGTSVISGEGCVTDAGPGDVEVFVFLPDNLEEPALVGTPDINEDGSWSIPLTTQASDAGRTFIVTATCFENEESDTVVAEYDVATITVTGTPSTGPVAPPTLGAAAPAAVAVTAEPTFTG